jgi:PhnB protein
MNVRVSAIPQGYHSITPYLIVEDADKAIAFYQAVFNASEIMRVEKPNGKIGHAELQIGGSKIMLADEFPEMDAKSPKAYGGSPVMLHLYIDDVDEVIMRAQAKGAKLLRPIEDMFYGDRSGTIEDPFGHKWDVSTHIEDVSHEELLRRSAELFDKKK